MEIEQDTTLILPPKPLFTAQEPEEKEPVKRTIPTKTKKPVAKKTKQAASAPIDEQARQQLHLVLTAAVGGLCLLLISDKDYIPETQELDSILPPLESILLRRIHMSGTISPDFNDLVVLLFGLATYGARIRTVRANRKSGSRPNTTGNIGKSQPIQTPANGKNNTITAFPGLGESWDAIDGLKTAASDS